MRRSDVHRVDQWVCEKFLDIVIRRIRFAGAPESLRAFTCSGKGLRQLRALLLVYRVGELMRYSTSSDNPYMHYVPLYACRPITLRLLSYRVCFSRRSARGGL